jgi:hypothetical protein
MVYLTLSDLLFCLRTQEYDFILAQNSNHIIQAEAYALDRVSTALAAFDTAFALAPIRYFDPSLPYPARTQVADPFDQFYVALLDLPANSDLADPLQWQPGDTRPPALVQAVAALTTYTLMERLSPGTIPAGYQAMATRAEHWLHNQATGLSQALLPRRLPASRIVYGGTPQLPGAFLPW